MPTSYGGGGGGIDGAPHACCCGASIISAATYNRPLEDRIRSRICASTCNGGMVCHSPRRARPRRG